MNILITGAKGQLGRDCVDVLSGDHTVHGYGSRELDIGDRDQVFSLVRTIRPEVVLNCAAYTAVDACETNRDLCYRVNRDGAEIVASACAETKTRLIHISTDYVFDGGKSVPQPYLESDPVAPLSRYGASKLAGEEKIRQHTDNHLIIRTAWLYGMGGGNFLKTMLRLALSDPNRTVRVVNDQFGSLTWTYRLAEQIETLLAAPLTGTVHATAEGKCTWYEGAKVFLKAMQVPFSLTPCPTAEYPTPAHRPANSILENSVLKKAGLNRMIAWQDDVLNFAEKHHDELLAELKG